MSPGDHRDKIFLVKNTVRVVAADANPDGTGENHAKEMHQAWAEPYFARVRSSDVARLHAF